MASISLEEELDLVEDITTLADDKCDLEGMTTLGTKSKIQ